MYVLELHVRKQSWDFDLFPFLLESFYYLLCPYLGGSTIGGFTV